MMGLGFGGLGMIIFWVVLIAAATYLVRSLSHSGGRDRDKSSPVEILKSRYASGEISHEEYQRMKRELVNR